MKTKDLQQFLERGYFQFPYIIIRKFPTVYVQLPIHRWALKKYFTEGLFMHSAYEEVLGYEEACHVLFELYHQEESEAKGPMDMCLVLGPDKARFIGKNESDVDENGQYKYGPIPWGGVLLTYNGEVMRLNESHYIL